jgi:hypothetical protein
MLTGRSLFVGESMSDVLAEVLKTAPDFASLPSDTPCLFVDCCGAVCTKTRSVGYSTLGWSSLRSPTRLRALKYRMRRVSRRLRPRRRAGRAGLVATAPEGGTGPRPALDMLFVQHWFEELTDLVPVN